MSIELGEGATEYANLGSAPPRPARRSIWWKAAVVGGSACLALFSSANLLGSVNDVPFFLDQLKVAAPIVHTGEWCQGSGAPLYTKTTLKRLD